MSADQDESGKPPDDAKAAPEGEPAIQPASRDSEPPLRGSMADLEQELAQLLDDAPEEDEDDEDDDAPLVPPPDSAGLPTPNLEPFDSDPDGLAGAGYDSWGPKIDLSAELPAMAPGLDAEDVKAALAPPAVAKPAEPADAAETEWEPGSKPDARPASDARSADDSEGGAAPDTESELPDDASQDGADRDEDLAEEEEDDDEGSEEDDADEEAEPDSDVPDTKPSARATPVTPAKRRQSTSSAPPASRGGLTPLRAVLVVLGLLAFVWLIRRSPTPAPPQSTRTEPVSQAADTPPREVEVPEVAQAPVEPTPTPDADSESDAAAAQAAPADSSLAPSPAPDASSLAGNGPLPFDRVSVLSALGPFAIEAARCRRKPDPSGRVMVNVIIEPSGRIKSIATGPKHSGTKTEECILAKLRRAKLEPHAGGDETVALPVQLK